MNHPLEKQKFWLLFVKDDFVYCGWGWGGSLAQHLPHRHLPKNCIAIFVIITILSSSSSSSSPTTLWLPIIVITKPFSSSLGSTSSTSLPNLSLRPIRFASSESPSPPKWTKTYYDLIMIDDLMICWENRQSQNIFHIWGIQLTFVCLWFHMFCKVKNEIGKGSPSMSTFRLCCKNEKRVKLLVAIYWLVAQLDFHLAMNVASRYMYW